eukprot:COSAG05_NODE_2090_length_3582_cov_5.475452_2_plen_84_part_00
MKRLDNGTAMHLGCNRGYAEFAVENAVPKTSIYSGSADNDDIMNRLNAEIQTRGGVIINQSGKTYAVGVRWAGGQYGYCDSDD